MVQSKYVPVVKELIDDELYTAASIARFAIDRRLVHLDEKNPPDVVRQRTRIAMARKIAQKGLPQNGDGLVKLEGLAPTPGWSGRRWKEAFGIEVDHGL